MKLIELVGMPRSGKTTQAELIKKALETRGKSVLLLSDRERLSAHARIMAFLEATGSL